METKKLQKAGGCVIGIIMVGSLFAAVGVPIYFLLSYFKHSYLAHKLRKKYKFPVNGYWLTDQEINDFKQWYAEEKNRYALDYQKNIYLRDLIAEQHQKAINANLRITDVGRYYRNSNLGKDIQDKIDELEKERSKLDLNQYEISCRQPLEFWNELNDLLRKKEIAIATLLGWICGAYFFYTAYKTGAPFNVWIDLYVAAFCAGIGYTLAILFSRNPALEYMAKPITITINNVDKPIAQKPQKRRLYLKLASVCLWFGMLLLAREMGKEYGSWDFSTPQEIAYDPEVTYAAEEAKVDTNNETPQSSSNQPAVNLNPTYSPVELTTTPENHRGFYMAQLRQTAHSKIISQDIILNLNMDEIEDLLLNIYARHGTTFENTADQKWADNQTWYKKTAGRTIHTARQYFDEASKYNVSTLVSRWNEIQVSEGHAPLPEGESPLITRSASPDIEGDNTGKADSALKAIPVDEFPVDSQVLKALPVEAGVAVVRGNLNSIEIQKWDIARIRYEINTIYARHGVVFPKREIQEYFESKVWYKPVPGRTFDDVEKLLSPEEKIDIEALANRRQELEKAR